VKTNMPNGNGGSLSASTYNDLVALILKSNNFPARHGRADARQHLNGADHPERRPG
jgi:hypothetical protein